MSPHHRPLLAWLVLTGLLGSGCDLRRGEPPAIQVRPSARLDGPVARSVVYRDRLFLPAGSPVELTYRFEPGAGFRAPASDLVVAARWVDPAGEEVVTMDHRPPIPARRWRPGEPVEYRDLLPLPPEPCGVPLTLRVGLYDPERPEQRWRLEAAGGQSAIGWDLAVIHLVESPGVQWRAGWRRPEGSADGHRRWRWMAERGSLRLVDPGGSGYIHLRGATRPECFPEPPLLSWRVHGSGGPAIRLTEEILSVWLPVRAPTPGPGPWLNLDLDLNRTFRPDDCDGKGDQRRLGLRVEEVRFTRVRLRDGWYHPEHHRRSSWRWTGPEARAELTLPGGPTRLLLSGRVPRAYLEEAPRVTILLDGKALDSFRAEGDLIDRVIPLPGGAEERRAELTLNTDRTYRPGGGDDRELGLQVDYLEVAPIKDAPPRDRDHRWR